MDNKSIKRRDVLRVGSTVAASGLALAGFAAPATAAASRIRVAALSEIVPGKPVEFSFPKDAAAALIDLGEAVADGVGPNRSITAFSTLCQHQGCPVEFHAESKEFVCGCHASRFDVSRGGMAVEGPATRGLPRIALEIEDGVVYATGVAEGVVYGYACDA